MSALAVNLPILYTGQIDLYINQSDFDVLQMIAPTGGATVYDQQHLSLYAALLEAERVGLSWVEVATNLMGLDPDQVEAEQCWRSHLDRARWITRAGLASALEAFGQAKERSGP